ncbi:MAG: DNA internalization-related competence protein ComEC/Rec2, partial [Nitrospirae bacterium]|nr:DNA internalization-related competence protein ComEC/Rec2 [Nitrospirota bacterium]
VIAAGAGFFYMLYDSRVPPDDVSHYATGEKVTLTGMVDEPARFSSKKVTANVRALKIFKGEEGLPVSGRVKVTVYDPDMELNYGDIIQFTGRLKIIRGFKNPGLFDYSGYVAREGFRAGVGIGKKENITKTGTGGSRFLRKIYQWREEIRLSITRGLSGPSSGILQAMAIGATGDLTTEVRDKFTAAGVTHILSISGSHLGFVSLLIFFMIRYTLIYLPYRILLRLSLYMIPSKIAALCTFIPLIFYTLLSGGEIATVRSLIMALVYLTAILIERDDDAINTLVIAALLVLLWDPQALFDISFQLSYMAVFSMIMVVERFHKKEGEEAPGRWKRYSDKFILFLLLTLGATISTAPIVACYYNQMAWAGVISNMIIVPFVGFIVLPVGLFSSFLALIWHADVLPLAWLNDLLLGLLYRIVELFARFPWSVVYTPSPGIILIIVIYMFILSLLFIRYRWAKIALPLSIFLLTFDLGCSPMIRDKGGLMRVTFMDVGQGDSSFIEFPDGKVMVIDGGGTFSETFDIGRSVVAPYLWNAGIRNIDYMVLSHPQLDHMEGLIYLLDKFPVGEVWTNGIGSGASYSFDSIVQGKGIRHVSVYRGMKEMIVGGCRIRFLNSPLLKGGKGEKSNNLSVVMRLACKDISFLFTGDIEAEAMREIAAGNAILHSTVIKVPHHGARGSVEEGFISAAAPGAAVISAGYQNSYHHPSPEAISAYQRGGASIYRTDLDGAVIVEVRNGKREIKTYKDMAVEKADLNNFSSTLTTELSNLKKIMEGYRHGGL